MKRLLIVALALAAALGTQPAARAAAQTRFATLYNLTGGYPVGLISGNGVLYGATAAVEPIGGNCGTIFQLQPPAAPGAGWTETQLYSFIGNTVDGCTPVGAPALGPNGALYGFTNSGGAYLSGAVYELQPPASPGGSWTESVLYSFDGPTPTSLVIGRRGSLYITTTNTLFELQPPSVPGGTWTGAVLYTFPPVNSAGYVPVSLTIGDHGVFYGTTLWGGSAPAQGGVVFDLSSPLPPHPAAPGPRRCSTTFRAGAMAASPTR